MFQQTILIGKIGKIEPRATAGGTAVVSYQVATSKSIKDKQTGNWEEKTEWHRCKSFAKTADYVRDNLKVGDLVQLTGEKETTVSVDPQTQQKRYFTDLIVFNFPKKMPTFWKKTGDVPAAGVNPAASHPQGTAQMQPAQPANGVSSYMSTFDEDEFGLNFPS